MIGNGISWQLDLTFVPNLHQYCWYTEMEKLPSSHNHHMYSTHVICSEVIEELKKAYNPVELDSIICYPYTSIRHIFFFFYCSMVILGFQHLFVVKFDWKTWNLFGVPRCTGLHSLTRHSARHPGYVWYCGEDGDTYPACWLDQKLGKIWKTWVVSSIILLNCEDECLVSFSIRVVEPCNQFPSLSSYETWAISQFELANLAR